jgi:hypothetical protein
MTGLAFETTRPSMRSITIGGVAGKGVVFSWGEWGKYQIFFSGSEEGRLHRTVYNRAGRFELSFYGEIEAIRTIRCDEAALQGTTLHVRRLPGLQVLDLQGTAVKVKMEDFEGLALRELVVTGSGITGSLQALTGQTELEELRLSAVTGLSGNIGVVAHMPKLRVLDLHGCSGMWYSGQVLPTDWVAPEIDLSDMRLSAAAVDQLLIDLAGTGVHDGQLQIAGNNAAHTAASDAAIAALRGAEWVVVANGAQV